MDLAGAPDGSSAPLVAGTDPNWWNLFFRKTSEAGSAYFGGHLLDGNERPSAYWANVLATCGFVAVAFAQVSNMILARANAGEVPPFSLACARWSLIALGLSPFLIKSFNR